MEPFVDSSMSLAVFESPHRFRSILKISSEVLGERRYAICRELTKVHQQVFRSRLPYIPSESEVPSKGEFVIVIEGARRNA
jgi:16S rRNA (cytidine1402-2'-O)-methyltransferase